MATGTGKTFVAMQIVWKLWNSRLAAGPQPTDPLPRRPQRPRRPAHRREFEPAFGARRPPIWKLRGEAKIGREIYFALYQQLADSGDGLDGMFREFAPDFFDLVIVDECHRGSARADSSWRRILDHFASGDAARHDRDAASATRRPTPTTTSATRIFEYSLAQGIDDGFLAPYRVRRVVLSPDAHGWAPDAGPARPVRQGDP